MSKRARARRTGRRTLLAAVIALVGVGLVAAAAQSGETTPTWVEAWGVQLARHTQAVDAMVGTRVDYRGLRGDPAWGALVAELGSARPPDPAAREEQLAFWINAYNVLAMNLVANHYPVESIKDIGSLFRSVWKVEAGRIGGRGYSLDEIEHEILRPMGEPRIHAAIVCASVSCPNLLREPFVAGRIDQQLDASARAWLARPEKGMRVDRVESTLWLSPILDWFEDDFGGRAGVLAFVARYADAADAAWIRDRGDDVSVEYFDYDWSLNE